AARVEHPLCGHPARGLRLRDERYAVLAARLEAQRLAHRGEEAGEERRPVAGPGRAGGPAPGAVGVGERPLWRGRQRARRCAREPWGGITSSLTGRWWQTERPCGRRGPGGPHPQLSRLPR